MTDLLEGLPAHVQASIRRIWASTVASGSERYKRSGDRSGLEGQKEISQLIQQHGVLKGDPRWTAIRDHGRLLYYGTVATSEPPTRLRGGPFVAPSDAEGPAFTKDSSFRARMEARQRTFRVDVLGVGYEKYGHWLDQAAAERGANFVHPAALAAVTTRAATGKGVDPERTFANMLASQAMCFNLFGPLASSDEGRKLAAVVLARFVPGLTAVRSILIEHTPDADIFRDQSGPAGVDCDVLVEFDDEDGACGVLVIETKLVESTFSRCGHRKGSEPACPSNVQLGEDFSGCRYSSKNRFLYWQRTVESQSLRLPLVRDAGCPFGGASWQLWVNHTLAHVEAARRGASRAVFAVCAPRDNEQLLEGETVIETFRRLTTDPERAVFMPLEEVLATLKAATSTLAPDWSDWAITMCARYVLCASPDDAVVEQRRSAVTEGHRSVVQWMATADFKEVVDIYATAAKRRGHVYFRPTDGGVVMIGLHDDAPFYVGLRTHKTDAGYSVRARSTAPSLADAEARWMGFESWLRTLKSSKKEEERGVIGWLRRALESALWLPELGEGWVFLHQEWRFLDDAGLGKKSDVLAAHLPTGRLGIVELKDDEKELPDARAQVDGYGRFWKRDAAELAPLFTNLLRAQGALYRNDAAAAGTISTDDALLFVGVSTRARGVRVTSR